MKYTDLLAMIYKKIEINDLTITNTAWINWDGHARDRIPIRQMARNFHAEIDDLARQL